jgi:PAS domain S-box-containing protein
VTDYHTTVPGADRDPAEIDFRALAALRSDLQFRLDCTGEFTYVSDAAERFFGRSPAETVGAHYSEVLEAADLDRAGTAFERLLDGERVSGLELELTAADGPVRLIRVDAEPVVEDGSTVGARGVATDVGDRRQRRQVVEVLDRVLRHNLRNGMSVVVGEAERMQADSDDPVAVDAGRRIQSAGEDLLALADTAREIRQVVVDHADADPVAPASTVRTVCDRLAGRYPDADLRVDAAPVDAGPVAAGIETVTSELVENALEHATHAEPTVSVVLQAPAPGQVRLEVTDDGSGLPEMEQRVLLEGQEEPLCHGQGLGLWLTHWLVTDAGGGLEVTTTDDEGTSIQVDLPTVAVDGATAGAVTGPESAGADADD